MMAKKRKTAKKTDVDIDKILAKHGYGKPRINKSIIAGIAIAAVLVVAILLILRYFPVGETAGKALFMEVGESGFIRAANDCEAATYEKKIGTATFSMEITPDCIIIKKVIAMDESEPKEIRDLFVGAEMECTYDRGNFDTDYVTQISGNLGYCTGTLVDAI